MKAKNPNKKHNDAFSALLSLIADPVLLSIRQVHCSRKSSYRKIYRYKSDNFVGKNLFKQQVFDKKLTAIIRKNLKRG